MRSASRYFGRWLPLREKLRHAHLELHEQYAASRKEKMHAVDGVYGAKMSAHQYFRDFSYADSCMIPWLLVAELMSVSGKSLSELVGERMAMYPARGSGIVG